MKFTLALIAIAICLSQVYTWNKLECDVMKELAKESTGLVSKCAHVGNATADGILKEITDTINAHLPKCSRRLGGNDKTKGKPKRGLMPMPSKADMEAMLKRAKKALKARKAAKKDRKLGGKKGAKKHGKKNAKKHAKKGKGKKHAKKGKKPRKLGGNDKKKAKPKRGLMPMPSKADMEAMLKRAKIALKAKKAAKKDRRLGGKKGAKKHGKKNAKKHAKKGKGKKHAKKGKPSKRRMSIWSSVSAFAGKLVKGAEDLGHKVEGGAEFLAKEACHVAGKKICGVASKLASMGLGMALDKTKADADLKKCILEKVSSDSIHICTEHCK